MVDPVVKTYVDKALDQLRRIDLMYIPGDVPGPMQDPSLTPEDDWVGWKPVPSTVTDAQLDALEEKTTLAFPSLYRDFLKYLHFFDLTEFGIRFESHPCTGWSKRLQEIYFEAWEPERIIGIGLLPFGDEAFRDSGPVCFDTRHRLENGDCPIVNWDHEWLGTDKEIQPMFSSCAKMFACLAFAADTDINFYYQDVDEDSPDLLAHKRELLSQFLDLDPDGAGGPGRAYWTGQG